MKDTVIYILPCPSQPHEIPMKKKKAGQMSQNPSQADVYVILNTYHRLRGATHFYVVFSSISKKLALQCLLFELFS